MGIAPAVHSVHFLSDTASELRFHACVERTDLEILREDKPEHHSSSSDVLGTEMPQQHHFSARTLSSSQLTSCSLSFSLSWLWVCMFVGFF